MATTQVHKFQLKITEEHIHTHAHLVNLNSNKTRSNQLLIKLSGFTVEYRIVNWYIGSHSFNSSEDNNYFFKAHCFNTR